MPAVQSGLTRKLIVFHILTWKRQLVPTGTTGRLASRPREIGRMPRRNAAKTGAEATGGHRGASEPRVHAQLLRQAPRICRAGLTRSPPCFERPLVMAEREQQPAPVNARTLLNAASYRDRGHRQTTTCMPPVRRGRARRAGPMPDLRGTPIAAPIVPGIATLPRHPRMQEPSWETRTRQGCAPRRTRWKRKDPAGAGPLLLSW